METCFEHLNLNTVLFNLCEFHNDCKDFARDSHTCLHGGGKYCGEFRSKIKEQLEKKQHDTLT